MRPFSEPLVDPKCRQSIVNSSQNRCWPFAKHVSFGVPFWSNFGTILDPSWAIGALWGTFFLDQFYDFFGARFWSQSGPKNGLVHRGAAALRRHCGGTVAALAGPAGEGESFRSSLGRTQKATRSGTPMPVKDWRGGSKSAARKAATVPFLCLFPNFWCLLGSVGEPGGMPGTPHRQTRLKK